MRSEAEVCVCVCVLEMDEGRWMDGWMIKSSRQWEPAMQKAQARGSMVTLADTRLLWKMFGLYEMRLQR